MQPKENISYSTNSMLKLALDFVESTGKNVFLTGKAGTGKTTFLHNLKDTISKRMVVVAPTGVAAINAGGVTIHSFFQLPFGPLLPGNNNAQSTQPSRDKSSLQRFSRVKIDIIKSLDLLVIDEVSMVRADLLDGIDEVLRRYRFRNKPFGGVQLLMIGDLQQLTPIAKDDEWAILKESYETIFFFSSKALRQTNFVSIELKQIFRQSDQAFINLLNKVRNNQLDEETIAALNKRHIANFAPHDNEGYITLTTHNYQAQNINQAKLKALKTKAETFTAKLDGDFPEHAYPTDYELTLKEGAQVMFVKNDPSHEKLFFNGKIGTLEHIDDDELYVQCPGDPSPIIVSPLKWDNTKYTIDNISKEIKESVTGSFVQYPLKLAWAITIHKSQGLTFDKAIIDAQAAFAHGQVYVALSRCRTLEGIVLNSRIGTNAVITDKTVMGFSREVENNQPTNSHLVSAKLEYQRGLLLELFDFVPILKRFDYTQRLCKDNVSSFPPQLAERVTSISNKFKTEICDVSERFMSQIEKYIRNFNSVEDNKTLQDRIIRAVPYFVPKLEEEILQSLADTSYESDNIDLEGKAKDQFERIFKALGEKIICLKNCEKGFKTLNFIEARAKASIDSYKKKKKKEKEKESLEISSVKHIDLFENLRQWRNNLADELNIAKYRVLHQNTLYEIANQLPYNIDLLKPIKGLGSKKISEFGDQIIRIVKDYRNTKGLNTPENEILDKEVIPVKKGKSHEISFTLFKKGKSINEIAKEVGLAESTIANHLSKYVSNGQIPVEKLVSKLKIETISQYFLNVDDTQLGSAKEVLGDDYSYNEIRWVLKHLQFLGKLKDEAKLSK